MYMFACQNHKECTNKNTCYLKNSGNTLLCCMSREKVSISLDKDENVFGRTFNTWLRPCHILRGVSTKFFPHTQHSFKNLCIPNKELSWVIKETTTLFGVWQGEDNSECIKNALFFSIKCTEIGGGLIKFNVEVTKYWHKGKYFNTHHTSHKQWVHLPWCRHPEDAPHPCWGCTLLHDGQELPNSESAHS